MAARCPEIETKLSARRDIDDVTVIDYGGDAPILVLVKPHDFCSGPEIRDLCAADLGDAAARVAVVLVTDTRPEQDEFPDPARYLADAAYAYRYEPPVTPTEQALVAIWNDVLERERTGALDDFLDLGGDSVRAVQLISRIEADLGVTVELGEFFDQPSVRALAVLVDSARVAP